MLNILDITTHTKVVGAKGGAYGSTTRTSCIIIDSDDYGSYMTMEGYAAATGIHPYVLTRRKIGSYYPQRSKFIVEDNGEVLQVIPEVVYSVWFQQDGIDSYIVNPW